MGDSIETLKKIFDCMCCKLQNDKKNERNEIVNVITDSAGNVDVKDDDVDFLEKEVLEKEVLEKEVLEEEVLEQEVPEEEVPEEDVSEEEVLEQEVPEEEVPDEEAPDKEDVKKELIIDNNTNRILDERHQVLPPQWILNGLEPPIETIDSGGFITVVYSEEQQKRLNVDKYGESKKKNLSMINLLNIPQSTNQWIENAESSTNKLYLKKNKWEKPKSEEKLSLISQNKGYYGGVWRE